MVYSVFWHLCIKEIYEFYKIILKIVMALLDFLKYYKLNINMIKL